MITFGNPKISATSTVTVSGQLQCPPTATLRGSLQLPSQMTGLLGGSIFLSQLCNFLSFSYQHHQKTKPISIGEFSRHFALNTFLLKLQAPCQYKSPDSTFCSKPL